MKYRIPLILLLLMSCTAMWAQRLQFKGLCDTLNIFLQGYTNPPHRSHFTMKLDSISMKDSTTLILYANEAICGQAFSEKSYNEFTDKVKAQIPEAYKSYAIEWRDKYNRDMTVYVPNYSRTTNIDSTKLWGDRIHDGAPWVRKMGPQNAVLSGGLNKRHLMVNASHGRYFDTNKWLWQRPYLFCTTEDLLTKSFIFPYLIPMLERAGSVVYSVRERDPQTEMRVVDNDNGASLAGQGEYIEKNMPVKKWEDLNCGTKGFAMPKLPMYSKSNPFLSGTARQISTTERDDHATASWIPTFDKAGKYAVYVSYATVPNSVSDALYIVKHKGQETKFRINQQMGGGTWVYLGTFDFDKNDPKNNCVILSNQSKEDGVVTADAVRWGGGMGMHSRGGKGTSGLPKYFEGGSYNALWSGIPYSTFSMSNPASDYNEDIRSRGAAANYIAGGSPYLPSNTGLKVPLEAVIAVHSDAGAKNYKTIIGTLGISTTVKPDGTTHFPSGVSRTTSIDLSTAILSSISDNLSKQWNTNWTRRDVWDRNYGESRIPDIPSIILEMFSHQNYTDFTFAHDPIFKQSMARAIYKGILSYVGGQHGETDCIVQPLAINSFAARLDKDQDMACLSWKPTVDTLSQNAKPVGYIVYTRMDNGDFDNGSYVDGYTTYNCAIQKGVRYDFKVTAINEGGESADSEILSVYSAPGAKKKVMIVNGFTRLSGPARVETSKKLGFDLDQDFGVPDHYTAAYAGRQQCFDRSKYGKEGKGALGYGGNELEGKFIGGNTFDYPVIHGAAIAACNTYSYESSSRQAWVDHYKKWRDIDAIDYIAGAECDAPHNLVHFKAFDEETRKAITYYLNKGGNLLVSGCYIGADAKTKEEKDFIQNTLKFEHGGNARVDNTNMVNGLGLDIPVHRGLKPEFYPVQAPDILNPTDPNAFPAFAYWGGGSAGIAYPGDDYRLVAMGFPFASISDPQIQAQAIEAILHFLFEKK